MKKRIIAAAMVMVLGILMTGCGGRSTSAGEEIAVKTAGEAGVTADAKTESVDSADADTESVDSADAGSGNTGTGTGSASETQLTGDGALALALADSGLQEDELTGTRVKTDREHGSLVYEVDLYADAVEYEYEIDASSGEILERDQDYEEAYSSTVSVPSGVISRDEAIALVLERVDGATEWNLRIGLDMDDGQCIWEGDLYYDGVEYEFEISGSSGTFLEWER